MSVRSNDMRIAILHAPGDEALAERVRQEIGLRDVLIASMGTRRVAFGPQLVLLALWSQQARGLEEVLRQITCDHASVVLWRVDGAAAPDLEAHVIVLGADSTPASILPALRLAEIEGARPRQEAAPRRRSHNRLAATALGVAIAAAVGAAGAAAVMLDGEAPLRMVSAQPAPAPSADLRSTTSP